MSKKRIRLKVAAPCNADWAAMKGDDAIRHCGLCKKNVYQLSNMTTEQVETLLSSKDDTCVRFYQRKDGTILVDDCQVGVKKRRRKQAIAGVSAGLLSAFGLAVAAPAEQPVNADTQAEVFEPISGEYAQPPAVDMEELERLANELLDKLTPDEPPIEPPIPHDYPMMGAAVPMEVMGDAVLDEVDLDPLDQD